MTWRYDESKFIRICDRSKRAVQASRDALGQLQLAERDLNLAREFVRAHPVEAVEQDFRNWIPRVDAPLSEAGKADLRRIVPQHEAGVKAHYDRLVADVAEAEKRVERCRRRVDESGDVAKEAIALAAACAACLQQHGIAPPREDPIPDYRPHADTVTQMAAT